MIDDAILPASPIEVMNRILLHAAAERARAKQFSIPLLVTQEDRPLYYVRHTDDLAYALRELQERGFIRKLSEGGQRTPKWTADITTAGWERIAELQSRNPRSWQAFVAMRFSEQLMAAFDDGIAPALRQTGYEPRRVDQIHHNEKIDDRIIAELKQSTLVIADFTEHRGGVYFEAGFAMGRGTPVIWTCREDDIGNAHFDTRQYNHIAWSTPVELRTRLVDRIRATVAFRSAVPPTPTDHDLVAAEL